jgi:hypothetical protein
MLDLTNRSLYAEGYPEKADLGKFDKVRWLDALDLEVAGDDGENLLASVLVRIIENLMEGTGASSVFSQDCDDAMKKLEDLATDIGIAWEGNLIARAGSLDPDTFSEEVMRTQRARLGVNKRLEDALDKFAKDKCFGCNEETLFVLPVDDFYLKPNASLQLLRLLRMISIPRLFFLVMGDIKTVEALFIEKSLADWTAVAGPELFIHHPDRLDEALTRARELRARYLRKLLPPGQRTEIEVMDWHEALDFAPLDVKEGVITLEHLLDRIELDKPLNNTTGKRRESLHTFLISPSVLSLRAGSNAADPEADVAVAKLNESLITKEYQKRQSRKKGSGEQSSDARKAAFNLNKHRSAYTALQIFDGTPREVMDIYAGLREVKRERENIEESIKKGRVPEDTRDIPVLLKHVAETVNLAKDEQSFFSDRQQKALENILPTRSYAPEDMIFKMDCLEIKTSGQEWKGLDKDKIKVRSHASWDIKIKEKFLPKLKVSETIDTQENSDPYDKLPPRQAAWFVLLHDLTWEWNTRNLTQNLVKTVLEQLGKSESGSEYLEGWAATSDGGTWTHFHLPEFEIFRDLDRFLHIWSLGLKWLEKNKGWETTTSDEVKFLWVLAGEIVIGDMYGDPPNSEMSLFRDFAENEEVWFPTFLTSTTTSTYQGRLKEVKTLRKIITKYPKEISNKLNKWRKLNL